MFWFHQQMDGGTDQWHLWFNECLVFNQHKTHFKVLLVFKVLANQMTNPSMSGPNTGLTLNSMYKMYAIYEWRLFCIGRPAPGEHSVSLQIPLEAFPSQLHSQFPVLGLHCFCHCLGSNIYHFFQFCYFIITWVFSTHAIRGTLTAALPSRLMKEALDVSMMMLH